MSDEMRGLLPGDLNEIRMLLRDPKRGTSNRDRDKARTRLKRLGHVSFDRKAWTWSVSDSGRALLAQAEQEVAGDG